LANGTNEVLDAYLKRQAKGGKPVKDGMQDSGEVGVCGRQDTEEKERRVARSMNRIREIRERVGLTQEQLAEMLSTTANSIWRLENGHTRLAQHSMVRLGKALGCDPAKLILNVPAEVKSDVVPADPNPVIDAIAAHIATRGLHLYKVTGNSVAQVVGVAPGDTITVDESEAAAAQPAPGDVVLVEIGAERVRVRRQFIPPNLVITNRRGANMINNIGGDPTVDPKIVGVLLRDKENSRP